MPTYDYQCRSCGSVTEVIHSMLAEGPTVCEQCGGPLRRMIYPTGIIFKGSGFYRTDSRNGGDSSSTESTSEAKPTSKPTSGSTQASGESSKGTDASKGSHGSKGGDRSKGTDTSTE